MRLVIFTLDSIFALIIATAGISLLAYFFYSPQTTTVLSYSSGSSILQNLLSATNTGGIAGSSSLYSNITYQANATSEVWDQFLNNQYANGGNPHGPRSSSISFITSLPTSSTPSRFAIDYGRAFFILGSTLYSMNATTGNIIWSKGIGGTTTTAPIIASGELIYANSLNLTAINPISNSLIWSVNSVTSYSQLIGYNNKIYTIQGLAQTRVVSAYYIGNGTLAWTYNLGAGGGNGGYIAIDQGSIAAIASGSTSVIALLQDFGNSANAIWSSAIPQALYGITTSQSANSIIAFMGPSVANAVDINGTTASNFPFGVVSQSFGYPTIYNNVAYYQSSNAVSAIAVNGVKLWTTTASATLGTAVSSAQPGLSSMPVVSNRDVYTSWSNGYVLALNLTSGKTDWAYAVPGGGSLYLDALAYGRLYATLIPASGNAQIIAFGACNPQQSGSILATAASLYANGQGSCADALANDVMPMGNYSIFLNNTFAPAISTDLFTGTNSYAVNPSRSPLNNLQVFSITGWINASSYPAGGCLAASPAGSVYSEGQPAGTMELQLLSNGELCGATWDQGSWNTITTSAIVPVKKWTFVALTLSPAGVKGTYTIYVNTNSLSGAGQPESSNPTIYSGIGFNVGSLSGQPNDYFTGSIANLQIYNTTLSTSQILQIYAQGIQGAPLSAAGLQAWYPLAGDTNDYSGLGDTQYPVNVLFRPGNYLPSGYTNSYQVSSSSIDMPLQNYTTGLTRLYKVGVISWH